ncbi:MAG: hypothetical protein CMI60_12460, partial [Parvibaculum sp.]|nr:hypothetical protein [Parvibaculum sp.]
NRLRPDNFSYEALEVLFEHFEHMEECTGQEMEFEVIKICCEWSESSVGELVEMYSYPADDAEFLLNKSTLVVGVVNDGRYVYQQF